MSLWKIRREFERLGGQLLEPYRQVRDLVLRIHYRYRHDSLVQNVEGKSPWSERVCILLIYQPRSIPESVFNTCKHLMQQGYACVLVSNGPLSQEDISRLLPQVSHLIVRPNFGYDFGGYQEGVLWLRQQNRRVVRLLLLNDSVWFPVFDNSNFLQQMEASKADVVGALSAERGRSQRHQRRLFYASFMLMFSEKVWLSQKFKTFWTSYPQTSSKARTIRKGERQLSAMFIHDDQFTHHAMVDATTVQQLIENQGPDQWRVFSQELSLMDAAFDKEREALLLKGSVTQSDVWSDWYQRLCDSQNMFACAQGALVVRQIVPFIKKSKDAHNLKSLQQSLSSFEKMPVFDKAVLKELRQIVKPT